MLELLLYSNVFVCYEQSKQQIFECFKPLNDPFSVVGLYIFKETCILLESLFYTELNGLCPNSIY